MSPSKPPINGRLSWPSSGFERISICQVIWLAIAIAWGAYHLLFVGQGGYMGIGTIIFVGVYLPSILLLIPTALLIKSKRTISETVKIIGYVYYGICFAWGLFLLRIPFL